MKRKDKSGIAPIKLILENRKLRRRVAELEQRLGLDMSDNKAEDGDSAQEHFDELTSSRSLYKSKSYFSYLLSQAKQTALWSKTGRVLKYSRFYLFLSRTFRTFMAITAWLQTSAALLFVATAAITLLPVLFILSAVVLIITFLYRNKYNKLLSGEIGDKTAVVFFASNGKSFKDKAYFSGMVRDMASMPNTVVFVVTPYFWGLSGLGGRGVFACARREGENLWLVRRYYYFFFRRTLLQKISDRSIYVY